MDGQPHARPRVVRELLFLDFVVAFVFVVLLLSEGIKGNEGILACLLHATHYLLYLVCLGVLYVQPSV